MTEQLEKLKLQNSELLLSDEKLNEELKKSKSTMNNLLSEVSLCKSELTQKTSEICGLKETVANLDSKKVHAENLAIESNARYETLKIDQLKSDAQKAKEKVKN